MPLTVSIPEPTYSNVTFGRSGALETSRSVLRATCARSCSRDHCSRLLPQHPISLLPISRLGGGIVHRSNLSRTEVHGVGASALRTHKNRIEDAPEIASQSTDLVNHTWLSRSANGIDIHRLRHRKQSSKLPKNPVPSILRMRKTKSKGPSS